MNYMMSGDPGDCIYSLVVMRHKGQGTLYLNASGLPSPKSDLSFSGFTMKSIEFMRPLLEAQPYIENVKVWAGEEIDVDLDEFRRRPIGTQNLCEAIMRPHGIPLDEKDRPWLTAEPKRLAKTIIARSTRHRNPRLNWRAIYESYDDKLFIGLPHEHELFCEEVGPVEYYPVQDLLDMAQVIQGSDLLIGNQSLPMALAVGLGHAYLQEVFWPVPNCLFARENAGYLFW